MGDMQTKLLMYHWTQDNFPKLRAGGIQVYQKNIIQALSKIEDLHLTVLSSGSSDLYDFLIPSIRIKRLPSSKTDLERFGLINSPVCSPTSHFFGNPFSLKHQEMQEVFFNFVVKQEIDAIHINHLDGLPAEVLAIKERLPHIKIIFSMHDYYSLCPQINFLYKGQELCNDSQNGKKCQSCLPVLDFNPFFSKKRADWFAFRIIDRMGLDPSGHLGKMIQDLSQKIFFRKTAKNPTASPSDNVLLDWHKIVDLINEHVDHVLPVSDRVRQIAIHHGIKADLLSVLRLGKDEAIQFRNEPTPQGRLVREDGCLTLVYLGYMTLHKGFFFLLEAFEKMPEELSQKINLVVAAKKHDDPTVFNRFLGLRSKLKSWTHYDGYTHSQLDNILEKGSIGLLCHIWEETGPLTAWEMHCRHIPFLTSDLGGATEMAGCEKMVYGHGNVPELIERIRMILEGKVTHEEYWKNSITPITVEEHCQELVQYYCIKDRERVSRGAVSF